MSETKQLGKYKVIEEIAKDIGREEHFHPTEVAVYFGEPNQEVSDPYFDGEGPDRVGCNFCGACMTGCRIGAKNTLDKNYLYFAEKNGATFPILADETGGRALTVFVDLESSKVFGFIPPQDLTSLPN